MAKLSRDQFVSDGARRRRIALAAEVRAAVMAEYASRLAEGAFWERVRLRRELEREVRRRIAAAQASPRALY